MDMQTREQMLLGMDSVRTVAGQQGALDEILRRVRNIWGAISSNQVIDKDVEGQAKQLLEYVNDLLRTSPSQVAPANPAQVTDARYDSVALEAAREIMTLTRSGVFDDRLKAKIQVRITEAITSAIGAGGPAVGYVSKNDIRDFDPDGCELVDVVLCPKGTLRPENEVSLYAHPAPSGQAVACPRCEGIGSMQSELRGFEHCTVCDGTGRIQNSLSQPHPADERVVEALHNAKVLLTALTGPDDAIAQATIAGIDAALSATEGRKDG